MAVVSRVRWFPRRVTPTPPPVALAFDPADFDPPLRTRLLILQPTPFCNIDCDYCYLPERDSTARMSLATVRRAAERLRDDGLAGPALTVVWHAGEPLAMPRAFYDDAIGAIDGVLGAHCAVTHSIQTNATLIDDAWCALIRRHGIRIGVSVDGPAALHDAHRRGRDGRGTHARVLRGIARLREHGIPFHAIAVVTPATFQQADAFVDFFEQQEIHELGCNVDEVEGPHEHSSLAGHEAEHAAFVARLLARCTDGSTRLRIRELALARDAIARPQPRQRWRDRHWPDNTQTLPFTLISVAHDGDFGSYSPELLGQPSAVYGDFVLGNVMRESFLDSARGEHFMRLWDAIRRGVDICARDCAYYDYCGGGAPANKLYENGDLASGETMYCRTMVQHPFDAVLARLERDREAWTQQRVAELAS